MEESVLNSTKKILGLDANYEAFDLDLITHINTAFFTLYQLGLGPAGGFMIEDADSEWEEFTGGEINLNSIKTYVYLRVRLYFDPPGTPHHIAAAKEQVSELEHRLLTERELTKWTAPQSSSPFLP